jgi:ubiquinone/menaquinone biosynthesis C-methylase UbiE
MHLFSSLHPQIPALPSVNRALDLGCGNRPIFLDTEIAKERFAADPYPCSDSFPVTMCKGENLPFENGAFDLVTARVAIPYMNIPVALREVRRVLSPDGRFWATLHLPRMARKRIVSGIRRLDFVDVLFQFYALTNCALLYFSDLQLSWRGRYESVQTPRSIRNALRRSGFMDIRTEISVDPNGLRHFAVIAHR